MWRVEHPPTNCKPNVVRPLCNLHACSFQYVAGVCHFLHQTTSLYISAFDKWLPLLASRNSLVSQHSLQQTWQTGTELIWISRHRSTNHWVSVIVHCMLGNLEENRADNLHDFLRRFWLTENVRDYLIKNCSHVYQDYYLFNVNFFRFTT